jgi:predicted alpha/beta-fold hydrolase
MDNMENRILNTADILDGELAYILEVSETIRKKAENNNFSISDICENLMEIRGKIQALDRHLTGEIHDFRDMEKYSSVS